MSAEAREAGARDELGRIADEYDRLCNQGLNREDAMCRALASADGETERLLLAYDADRNRLGYYEREINRTEGDPVVVERAENAQRILGGTRAALLAHVAANALQSYTVGYREGCEAGHAAAMIERDAALRPGTTGEGEALREVEAVINTHPCFTACHHEYASECTESIRDSLRDALKGRPA